MITYSTAHFDRSLIVVLLLQDTLTQAKTFERQSKPKRRLQRKQKKPRRRKESKRRTSSHLKISPSTNGRSKRSVGLPLKFPQVIWVIGVIFRFSLFCNSRYLVLIYFAYTKFVSTFRIFGITIFLEISSGYPTLKCFISL